MSDSLTRDIRINRDQLRKFVGDDPNAIRTLEQLMQNVNVLIEKVDDLEARVEALEGP